MYYTKIRMPRLSHSAIVKYTPFPSLVQQEINIQIVRSFEKISRTANSNESTNINYFLYSTKKTERLTTTDNNANILIVF